jgi:leucyl aminopeptidase (aminopeptidase T)
MTTPQRLSDEELALMVKRVFRPGPDDRALAVLSDLPDAHMPDTPAWQRRRQLAADWAAGLARQQQQTGLQARLWLYRNVRMNNADLPAEAFPHAEGTLPATADQLSPAAAVPMEQVLRGHQILLALTELSATAPLKLAAAGAGFRAATMPGFSEAMIPALRLDYGEINRRVWLMKELLDRASRADLLFSAGGQELRLRLDLRHRQAHASGGLFPDPGAAGNLPSGETYIVPYEGERPDDPSRSAGLLPVQFDQQLVVYEIQNNRALRARGDGDAAAREAARLAREPAYGNLAELGLGVLSDFGLQPTGDLLLDEKLGLHIAFGRSDHFGGQVGAGDFSGPEAVVHIDRVYLPSVQPLVTVVSVDLTLQDGGQRPLIRNDAYVIDF